ncbi:hypothetical protein RV10_GL002169 [Enterococcus pallens]|nr:hypothetical protein RV10_GL002169 [Enterococcus pallens]
MTYNQVFSLISFVFWHASITFKSILVFTRIFVILMLKKFLTLERKVQDFLIKMRARERISLARV